MTQYNTTPGEELMLHSYTPTSLHDWLLIDLWGKMQRDGSLQGAMFSSVQSLLPFCQLLAKPSTRLAMDHDGPYFCAWVEPMMTGVSLGLWIREDKRKSRQCLVFSHEVLDELLKTYQVVLVVTRDKTTSQFHKHFGFLFACEIPYIYEGDTAYISYLTQESYYRRYLGKGEALDTQDTPSFDNNGIAAFIQILAQEGV